MIHIKFPRDQIVAFCKQWKVHEFALFGSVLRDDFGPDSDDENMPPNLDLTICLQRLAYQFRMLSHQAQQLACRITGLPDSLLPVLNRLLRQPQQIGKPLLTHTQPMPNPTWIRLLERRLGGLKHPDLK
jgi:hypothetical protein